MLLQGIQKFYVNLIAAIVTRHSEILGLYFFIFPYTFVAQLQHSLLGRRVDHIWSSGRPGGKSGHPSGAWQLTAAAVI